MTTHDNDQQSADAPPPVSPYPDEAPGAGVDGDGEVDFAGADFADEFAAPGASPYPDGWGQSAPGPVGDPYAQQQYPPQQAGYGMAPAGYAPQTPYPQHAQYDPGDEFEPPRDLPPWYEDEYYDDRDWERLPRRTSTVFRVFAFAAVLFVAGFMTYRYVDSWLQDQLDPPGEPGASITIEVPVGATTNDIVRILADEEIVANSTVFRYYLRFKGGDEEYQAGAYTFRTNSAVEDVKTILEGGPDVVADNRVFVTLQEGLTLDEMELVLTEQLPAFDILELRNAFTTVERPSVFQDGIPLQNAEGWLFPETYDVEEFGASDELGFLRRMVAQFDLVATETGLGNAQALVGVSPYQALIIASLIEEEAQADVDRAKIARVIYNRIAQGMRLDIDATVVYALGGDRDLSAADLEVDSPYNTRRFEGLPPTPIAAPGRASIEAALNPELGDWLFYVRTDEFGPGSHSFAATLAEHEANVAICVERDLGCG